MGRSIVSIPHLNWRGGRPRFEPGPALRSMGYKGRDLKDAQGRWMDLAQAASFSEDLKREIEARRGIARLSGRKPRMPRASVAGAPALTTVEALFKAWFDHPSMKPSTERRAGIKPRAKATIHFYRTMERIIASDEPEIHGAAAGALDKVICFNLYERMVVRRGVAMGAAAIRTLSAALSFGIRRGLVPLAVNPCERLGMQTAQPRLRVADRSEIEHLVRAADLLDRPEIGDSIMLGVWTAQRQADRLQLLDEGLLNNRRYFRQQKTGAIVAIPEAPMLSVRLAAARLRRRPLALQRMEIVINERDNAPWQPDHYRHVFLAIVRAATYGVAVIGPERVILAQAEALKGVTKYLPGVRALRPGEAVGDAVMLVDPLHTLADFHDQDLRDTAVTWLALAGCTIPEICAVTGHSLETATTILKHYLARHPELADHAIAKLVAWHG